MKKFFIALIFISSFTISAFCLRDFIEGCDYTLDFQEKSPEMAAVLHVNFIGIAPELEEAEKIVKKQLKIYGNKLVAAKRVVYTEGKRIRYKNIIGSLWKENITDPENPTKIRFNKDLSAYVWIGKTKAIVPFPDYMAFLKRQQKEFRKKQKLDKSNKKNQQTI
jgi:hypothetical protein